MRMIRRVVCWRSSELRSSPPTTGRTTAGRFRRAPRRARRTVKQEAVRFGSRVAAKASVAATRVGYKVSEGHSPPRSNPRWRSTITSTGERSTSIRQARLSRCGGASARPPNVNAPCVSRATLRRHAGHRPLARQTAVDRRSMRGRAPSCDEESRDRQRTRRLSKRGLNQLAFPARRRIIGPTPPHPPCVESQREGQHAETLEKDRHAVARSPLWCCSSRRWRREPSLPPRSCPSSRFPVETWSANRRWP